MTAEVLEAITMMMDCEEDDIPNGLYTVFEMLDEKLEAANPGFEAHLRNTQVVALVVTLWDLGILKDIP